MINVTIEKADILLGGIVGNSAFVEVKILNVEGEVKLVRAIPQGTNKFILMLELLLREGAGSHKAHYQEIFKGDFGFASVTVRYGRNQVSKEFTRLDPHSGVGT